MAELVQDAILSWWRVCSHYITEANGMKASCGVTSDIFDVVVCVPVQGNLRYHGRALCLAGVGQKDSDWQCYVTMMKLYARW